MAEPYVGEIRCFGFTFAPRFYMFCDGQLLPIQRYSALFSILGTTYGGDGRTTFALPNLQGRIPMHWGPSNTGLNTVIGEEMGTPTVSLISTQLPAHYHQIFTTPPPAAADPGRSEGPTTASFFSNSRGALIYATNTPANAMFSPKAIWPAGSSMPHDNMQPYLTMNFCIAVEGIFPARN